MAVGKKGKKTKHKIFTVALKLFREKGFSNVTVDEIVKEAGIAKGTFYIYFPSKGHVIAEIFMEADLMYEEYIKELRHIASPTEKLRQLLDHLIEMQYEILGYDLSVIGYRTQLDEHVEYSMSGDRTIYTYVTSLIREGQETGEMNRDAAPEYYARILLRGIRGAIYEWCMSSNNYDFVADGKTYVGYLLKILAVH